MARSLPDSREPLRKRLGASADQLLNATASLLSEQSALDVSLSDIGKRSGLNPALIKYYFGNKEGLLVALLERDAQVAMDGLKHLVEMELSAEQKLKIHISGIINTYHKSPYLNRLIHYLIENGEPSSSRRVAKIFIEPMVEAYRAIVAQGVTEGAFRPVDPALLYYSLVGSCEHIFYAAYSVPSILGEARISDDLRQRYIQHVADLVLRGLAPEPARIGEAAFNR